MNTHKEISFIKSVAHEYKIQKGRNWGRGYFFGYWKVFNTTYQHSGVAINPLDWCPGSPNLNPPNSMRHVVLDRPLGFCWDDEWSHGETRVEYPDAAQR